MNRLATLALLLLAFSGAAEPKDLLQSGRQFLRGDRGFGAWGEDCRD